MSEQGSGPPLVLIPGIQGRWEWVRPALDALSASFRVITFPLCGEPSSGMVFQAARGFDNYVEQMRAVMDRADVDRAVVCGISFGGLIALRFAATRPDRTAALILASTPGPRWRLSARHDLYTRLPYLFGPLFLAETPWRLRTELASAFPERADRRRFARWQLGLLVRAPVSPARMAERARLVSTGGLAADCARVAAPTLVVTGEAPLDRVVPVAHSTEYQQLIRGARLAVLARTGHLGSISRPDAFAAIVRDFVNNIEHAAA